MQLGNKKTSQTYSLFDVMCMLQVQKAACDKFNTDFYPQFKKWCDDYFYIKVWLL